MWSGSKELGPNGWVNFLLNSEQFTRVKFHVASAHSSTRIPLNTHHNIYFSDDNSSQGKPPPHFLRNLNPIDFSQFLCMK